MILFNIININIQYTKSQQLYTERTIRESQEIKKIGKEGPKRELNHLRTFSRRYRKIADFASVEERQETVPIPDPREMPVRL